MLVKKNMKEANIVPYCEKHDKKYDVITHQDIKGGVHIQNWLCISCGKSKKFNSTGEYNPSREIEHDNTR